MSLITIFLHTSLIPYKACFFTTIISSPLKWLVIETEEPLVQLSSAARAVWRNSEMFFTERWPFWELSDNKHRGGPVPTIIFSAYSWITQNPDSLQSLVKSAAIFMFDRDRGTECLLLTSDMMRVDVQHHLFVRSEIRPRGAGNELNADCRSLNSSRWNWALYTLAVAQQNNSRPVRRGIITEAAGHVKYSLLWEPSLPWQLEMSRER